MSQDRRMGNRLMEKTVFPPTNKLNNGTRLKGCSLAKSLGIWELLRQQNQADRRRKRSGAIFERFTLVWYLYLEVL
jgi:ABC-type amino acid transport system permease subunit